MNRFKVFNVGQDSSEEAAREIPTNMESNGAQYRSSLQAPTNEGRKFSLVTLTLYVYIKAIAIVSGWTKCIKTTATERFELGICLGPIKAPRKFLYRE